MAETQNRNKKPAATGGGTKNSTPQARSGGRSAAGVKQVTASSKAPAKKGASAKGDSAKGGSKGGGTQMEAKLKRKSEFALQFVPYILAVVVIFLGACFILDAIGGATTPNEHLMGFVGYYICRVLFGGFGWTAYVIPVLLINLIIFWKRNYLDGRIPAKSILSVVTLVFMAAVTHVAACSVNDSLAAGIDLIELYDTGALLQSGGVIGGLLGYLLYLALRLPGTIILSVLVFPLLIMYLIGVAPSVVFGKLGRAIKNSWKRSAEERAVRRMERELEELEAEQLLDEDESDEELGEEPSKDISEDSDVRREMERKAEQDKYRERRAKANERADRERARKTDTAEEIPEPVSDTESDSGENIVVNPRTGEVLGTEKGRDAKEPSRRDKKNRPVPVESETATLPLFDTPAAKTAAEPAEEEMDDEMLAHEMLDNEPPFDVEPDYVQLTAASVLEELDEEGDTEPDTMEVGYDDDIEPGETASGVRYEVVTDEGAIPVKSVDSKKPDPYATVRILKSETAAVAEAGLSEEEVVISSAHTAEEGAESEEEDMPPREYIFPPIDLLTKGSSRYEANEAEIAENTQALREVLESFRIGVKEISCSCGPTITRFEVKPDSGVRVRSIANLVDDIAMGLAKAGVRIEAPIPGKAAVGIEVPNADPATVYFRNILETPEFRNHKSRIAACLGADVAGRPVILDINKMPHLLVAGTTGSGKSVCINSIIMSILYKAKPDEVKLILIDPKKVEFAVYRDLPHLYCPIISDPKKAAGALNSAVNEMERRFELIEEVGVRNIAGYNEVTADDPARPYMPQMVIIIDELADLMMTASKEVETAICRLAQKARAAGMHLILGTQRPSTDVITGLIKANVPSRIAFTVTQSVDSRIIIDSVGAEKLIGRGDMLYSPVGTTKPLRVQGTFVSDGEVERVVTFLRENNERGEFDESFTRQIEIEAAKCAAGKKKGGDQPVDIDEVSFSGGGGAPAGRKDNEDPKFWEALEVAAGKDKIGTSALQRALNLGYGRAAKIIDRMEELGLVGPDPGTKQGRKVLFSKQDYLEFRANGLPTGGNAGGGGGDEDSFSEGDFDEL